MPRFGAAIVYGTKPLREFSDVIRNSLLLTWNERIERRTGVGLRQAQADATVSNRVTLSLSKRDVAQRKTRAPSRCAGSC
jgi:hypothetical protein